MRNVAVGIAVLIYATGMCQDKEINWKTNYEEALKEAKDAKKNLVVHFWTEW